MLSFSLRPVITLTTDFGTADHYVGTMKGVLLTRCPEAALVDISHELPPFSIYAAAYAIDQAAPYFPPGTVHLIVVDPGVGTARRPIVARACGQMFVAPDNGVLSMIRERDPGMVVREITNSKLWLDAPSSTFHGRDIFAPVAGALAAGKASPEDVGPVLESIELLNGISAEQVSEGEWFGRVLSVDRFGNVITNFRSAGLAALPDSEFEVRAGSGSVTRFHATFGEAPENLCFAYFGSSGYVELGMNQKNAADVLRVVPGDAISLRSTFK